MAHPASLHFLAEHGWCYAPPGLTRHRISMPGYTLAFAKAHQQADISIVPLPERPPAPLILRPSDVTRTLSMTSLAADADLGPGGGEPVVRRVIVLAHSG